MVARLTLATRQRKRINDPFGTIDVAMFRLASAASLAEGLTAPHNLDSLSGAENNTCTSHLPAILFRLWDKPGRMTTNFIFFTCFFGGVSSCQRPNLYLFEQRLRLCYQWVEGKFGGCEAFSLLVEARLDFVKLAKGVSKRVLAIARFTIFLCADSGGQRRLASVWFASPTSMIRSRS